MDLGLAFKKIRQAKGIKAQTLSQILGLHKSYISKVESGSIKPTDAKIRQIFKELDVPDALIDLLLVKESDLTTGKQEAFSITKPAIIEMIVKWSLDKFSPPVESNLEDEGIALVMQGGGVKGIAYVGALEELSKHYKFNRFIGTSAGAICAVLLGAGYSIEEIKAILLRKKFTDFFDSWMIKAVTVNLFLKGGLYKANKFTNWISALLTNKLGVHGEVTFADLPYRVTLYASTRDKRALVFDSQSPAHQNSSVPFFTRCSMSIPLLFTPQKHEGKNVYDGGLQNNFPLVHFLEENPDLNFIGLFLGDGSHKKRSTASNFVLLDLFKLIFGSNDIEGLTQYSDNTVLINPTPISTLDFSMGEKEKQYLLDCGKLYSRIYLKRAGLINLTDNDIQIARVSLVNRRKQIRRIKYKRFMWKALKKTSPLTIFFLFYYNIFNITSGLSTGLAYLGKIISSIV